MPFDPGPDEPLRPSRPPFRSLAERLGRAVEAVGGGRTGMELASTVLWARFLRFDASDPDWPDRDRFVLSGTRFEPLLAALLRLSGHGEVPAGTVFGHHPAVEIASGPPGQGFAAAVGMAAAERALARRFGRTLVDHRTWVLACETDLAAGVSLEAAALAARLEPDKLVVVADGAGTGAVGEPACASRFAAAGWAVRQAGRDDPDALLAALTGAMRDRRPTLLCCIPGNRAGAPDGGPAEDGGRGAPADWAALGARNAPARRSWLRRKVRHRDADAFDRAIGAGHPDRFGEHWRAGSAAGWADEAPADAGTDPNAALSGARHGLRLLDRLLPELAALRSAAGAAITPRQSSCDPDAAENGGAPRLRALDCGVAEHGMAAIGNGLALHGGVSPVIQAGLISVDRMRPALRLAALMGQRVIYLLHDERRGTAWQTVEQLASLRAMPNVMLFRPADATEALLCWELALGGRPGPRVIALSARDAAPAPGPATAAGPIDPDLAREGCRRGGYALFQPDGPRNATLLATGPEVAVALAAARRLAGEGIGAAVVSLPCWELFAAQPSAYRAAILGEAPRIGIEAASGFGWERWLGPDGSFIGLDGFGAAGPVISTARPTGPSPEMVAERVRHSLRRGTA